MDPSIDNLRKAIQGAYITDEAEVIERLLPLAALDPLQSQTTANTARVLIEAVRTTATHAIRRRCFCRS